ncbi:MAG: hypothetical protein IT292_01270 [Deltaproteobacteria bacterium]|nr:hypothetical protein [Deltaproteobacteria bacterium]
MAKIFSSLVVMLLLYGGIYYVVIPREWGDSGAYLADVFAYLHSVDGRLLEFGHLFWRFLIMLLMFGVYGTELRQFSENEILVNGANLIGEVNFIAGALCLLVFSRLLQLVGYKTFQICIGLAALLFFWPFLNHSRTASPYVFALMFLLLGELSWVKSELTPGIKLFYAYATIAVLCFSLAVSFWFPYILTLPFCLFLPRAFFDTKNKSVKKEFILGAICALVITLFYFLAIYFSQIRSWPALVSWFTESQHGKLFHGGFTKLIFGYANAHIYLGDYGKLVKRYLISDSYNPVTLADCLNFSLIRLISVYLFSFTAAIVCWYRERRLALVALLGVIPNILFAIYFDAGSAERYLALIIIEALVFGKLVSLSSTGKAKLIISLVVAAYGVATIFTLSGKYWLESQDRFIAVQFLAKEGDVLIVLNYTDPLSSIYKGFLQMPGDSTKNLKVYSVIRSGSSEAASWKRSLANKLQAAWGENHNIWVSRRLLNLKPEAYYGWVEGEDDQISWVHLSRLFSAFEYDSGSDGADGFYLLKNSDPNRRWLNSVR